MEYVPITPPPALPATTVPNAPTKWKAPRIQRTLHFMEPAVVGVSEDASEAPTGA